MSDKIKRDSITLAYRFYGKDGLPVKIVECWTRRWNKDEVDVWVLTSEDNLYVFYTYPEDLNAFCSVFELKTYDDLLRRIRHLWLHPGWTLMGKATTKTKWIPPPNQVASKTLVSKR